MDRACADPRKLMAARWITALWVALAVRAASMPRAMYTLYTDMPSNITMTRPKPAIKRWLIFHVCIGFYLGWVGWGPPLQEKDGCNLLHFRCNCVGPGAPAARSLSLSLR